MKSLRIEIESNAACDKLPLHTNLSMVHIPAYHTELYDLYLILISYSDTASSLFTLKKDTKLLVFLFEKH